MFKTKLALAAITVAFSVQAHADEKPYPTNQCMDGLVHEARLATIADKVALTGSHETSAAMLEIDRQANAAERTALALWMKLRHACFELGVDFRRDAVSAGRAALATRLFELHQRLLVELSEDRMSYAEFNRRRVEVYLIAVALEAQLLEDEQDTAPTGHAGI